MNEEIPTNKTSETGTSKGVEHKRGENFIDRYANNVYFEGSVWDLKLVFGSLDQSIGPNHVTQHTAISLPWAQVKLLAYMLKAHLIAHEAHVGRVQVLPGIIPPLPAEPLVESVPFFVNKGEYAKAQKLYEEFIAENPEVVPHGQQSDSKNSSTQ